MAVERTGPVITSAAILLSVALLALATSKLYLIKDLTIGQVLGVAIDVTLVRLVLVPGLHPRARTAELVAAASAARRARDA